MSIGTAFGRISGVSAAKAAMQITSNGASHATA
jgi:hypothetical protein